MITSLSLPAVLILHHVGKFFLLYSLYIKLLNSLWTRKITVNCIMCSSQIDTNYIHSCIRNTFIQNVRRPIICSWGTWAAPLPSLSPLVSSFPVDLDHKYHRETIDVWAKVSYRETRHGDSWSWNGRGLNGVFIWNVCSLIVRYKISQPLKMGRTNKCTSPFYTTIDD